MGAFVAVVYGIRDGFTTPSGTHHFAVGAAMCLLGLSITPRTQRVLVILRLSIAAAILGMYGIGFALAARSNRDFGEGLAIGGLLLISPIAIPLIVSLVLRTRSYWRAGAMNVWHPSRIWDASTMARAAEHDVSVEILEAVQIKQERNKARVTHW